MNGITRGRYQLVVCPVGNAPYIIPLAFSCAKQLLKLDGLNILTKKRKFLGLFVMFFWLVYSPAVKVIQNKAHPFNQDGHRGY